jgi:DNA-directed RNA polymerase subunit A"
VYGIEGILNAIVRSEGEEWIINTIGSNLEKILTLKEVDEKRTVTNDIHETEKILGIEAARNLIVKEVMKTLQEQGLDVDIRHIMLVSDIMTMRGYVRSIGRYGVAGAKTSILTRAAFEETIKHLVKASVMNEVDNFEGIFENVMVGQVIPSGTGMFDLVAKFEEEEK